jgi:mono/diheme cytochrome c family protein
MRRFFIAIVLTGTFAALSLAADKPGDGKALYRQNCKICHDKGSPHGVYTPMTMTQEQWRKFYSTKLIPAHKNVTVPQTGKKLLEFLTPDQMKSIQRFSIDHAADSEQPATCG